MISTTTIVCIVILVMTGVSAGANGFYGLFYTLSDARSPPVKIQTKVTPYNNFGYPLGVDYIVNSIKYNKSNMIIDNICMSGSQSNKFYFSEGDTIFFEVTFIKGPDGIPTTTTTQHSVDPFIVLSMGYDQMIAVNNNQGWFYTLQGKAISKIPITSIDYSYPIVFTDQYLLYRPLTTVLQGEESVTTITGYAMVDRNNYSNIAFTAISDKGAAVYMTRNSTHHIIIADMNIEYNADYAIIFMSANATTIVNISGISEDMLITTATRDNDSGIFFISTTRGLYISLDDGKAMATQTGMRVLNCISLHS